MTLAILLQQVVQESSEQFQQAAVLPDDVRLDFDPWREETSQQALSKEPAAVNPAATRSAVPGLVWKTSRRTVVSLEHGCFQAREIVRQQTTAEGHQVLQRSAQLAELVPRGARYGFDLIAYVGVETYLHGRALEDVQQTLAQRRPALTVPLSSLWDQQQKFLFSLGRLHRRAVPVLREFLANHGPMTWLLDGTLEPDTPVFFGIQDAASGLFLDGWKIPSENADDIAVCLAEAAARYGRPHEALHDLSPAMSGACDKALHGVSHRVCHFHLAQDVGEDLYAAVQLALTKRQRTLKILSRLREQRRGQTEWLRDQLGQPSAELVLSRLLAGEPVEASWKFHETLGREVLLAFHFWILDYRHDGRRRGFPFDPYTLYLHRRLVRAGEAVDRLLSLSEVARQAPPVLTNFHNLLAEYRGDAEIAAMAAEYERASAMFARLREALSLSADQMRNLRQPYELPAAARQPLHTALHELRASLRCQVEQEDDPDRLLAHTVLTHLDKYWAYLVPEEGVASSWERTTNKLESRWSTLKRHRRQTHGRGKLTRDFQSLPEEYLLVGNLENPLYVELLLGGSLASLASKLAEASVGGESFTSWRERRGSRLLGQPRRRQLRADDFLTDLVRVSADQCQSKEADAA